MEQPLLVIDAYAQIFRGFYGIRYLSRSDGMPTNGIFAMAKFLLTLENDYPTTRGVFAFDMGKPSFRTEIAPDYKANRSPMPDELRQQIDAIRKVIELFGWNIIEHENYEADDLIAVIARNFSDQQVRIVSRDKDLAQLITDNVKMLVPGKKGGLDLQDKEAVFEKYGVHCEQILEYLALIGDSSDNIPGVRGVGPKTAAKLLNEFKTIDKLYKSIELVSSKRIKEKLLESRDILDKNIKLIALKDDLPMPLEELSKQLDKAPPKWNELYEFAIEMELKSLIPIFEQKRENSVLSERDSVSEAVNTVPPEPTTATALNEDDELFTPDLF